MRRMWRWRGRPGPGRWRSFRRATDFGYALNCELLRPAVFGEPLDPLPAGAPGRLDAGVGPGAGRRRAALQSRERGGRAERRQRRGAAVRDAGDWEVIQFRDAELVAPREYRARRACCAARRERTASCRRSGPRAPTSCCSTGRRGRSRLPAAARGLERHYRVGPAVRSYDDPSYVHRRGDVRGRRAAAVSAGASPGASGARIRASSWRGRGARASTATAGRAGGAARARSARPISCGCCGGGAVAAGGRRRACRAHVYTAGGAGGGRRAGGRSSSRLRRFRSASGRDPLRGSNSMARTAQLDLPLVMPAQAQKHVTVNEALARLDAAAQLRVISSLVAAPPAAAADGASYLVPAGATGRLGGAWRGRSRSGATAAGRISRRRRAGGPGTRAGRRTRCSTAPAGCRTRSRSRRTAPAMRWRVIEFDHAVTPGASNSTSVADPEPGAGGRGDGPGGERADRGRG